MKEYYNELKEAFDFRNENASAIKEIEDKISDNLNRGFEINNEVFSMDKNSIEYGILMKEKEMLEKESDDLKVKKEEIENDFYKKIASVKNKLENDIKLKTEELEKNEKENITEAQTRLETAKKHLEELQSVSLKSNAIDEEIEITQRGIENIQKGIDDINKNSIAMLKEISTLKKLDEQLTYNRYDELEKEVLVELEDNSKVEESHEPEKEVKSESNKKESEQKNEQEDREQDKKDKEINNSSSEEKVVNDENIFTVTNKIDEAKRKLEEDSKNYSNIHLEPNQIIQDNPINEATRKNDKNVFEANNIINDVKKDMGLETENNIKPNFKITKEESNVETDKKQEKDKDDKSSNKITYIGIYEGDGNIYYENEKGDKDSISIAEVLENKKSQFRRLDIKNICKEIAGGRFGAFLLGRKVNPEIVSVLQHDTEQLKDYITSIYQKKELPFELIHDLDGIGILGKIKMNKFAKSEEKLGAKVIGKLFDRNRAIDGVKDSKMLNAAKDGIGKGVEAVKSKGKDFVQKIPNMDNHIEEKANEAVKQSQEQTAKDVQEIMSQNDKEEEVK